MKFANHRNEVERQIIVRLVEDLLAAGYQLGVFDSEERVLEHTSDEEKIFAAMSTTDEDYLLFARAEEPTGWIRLVYGNGPDVLSDYTTNLDESTLKRAEELAERFR